MEITYMVIIAAITLIFGAITKCFCESIPSKYIPLQNLVIGLLAAGVCLYFKIETDVLQAFLLCIFAAMGAGGVYDLARTNSK